MLLYWPVLGGHRRRVRSKTSILGPLKMKTWQALSCVQIRGVFLDFCPIHYKDKEEVLDGTKHTCLEDTHPRNILTERNGKRKHACTCTHICTLFDFALHKVIYYGTWRSFTNTHTHTQSQNAISHLCSCMMWPSRRVPGGRGAMKGTRSTSSLYSE